MGRRLMSRRNGDGRALSQPSQLFAPMKFARRGAFDYIMQDGDLQIATEGVECRVCAGRGMPERTRVQVQPQGLYRAAVIRLSGAARASEEELSRRRGVAQGLPRLVCRYQPEEG